MNQSVRRGLRWLPALVWYGIIWRFSAQTATVSGGLSGRLLHQVLEALSPAFAAASPDAQVLAVETLSFFERKCAHMFLYFVLALLVYGAVRLGWTAVRTAGSLGICAMLAALDELHQTMVPGRSGEVRDVLVDLGGAAIALALLALPALGAWCRKRRIAAAAAGLVGLLAILPLCLTLALGERFLPALAVVEGVLAPWGAVAPALQDAVFLAACGVLGALVPLAVLLAGARFRAAAGAAALAAALAGMISISTGRAGFYGCWGIALLGAVLAGAMWGLGDALDERSFPAWEAEEAGDLDEKKAQTEGHPLPEGESQA